MNWFERLTGFREESSEQVHRNIVIDGEVKALADMNRT